MLGGGSFINWLNDILFIVVALLTAITIHEYAHARMALALGDRTAKFAGRLSLDPMKHIDWLGALMLVLFKFGWAKPVPIDARNFKDPRKGMILVGLAGPVANIALVFLTAVVLRGLLMISLPSFVQFVIVKLGCILIIYNAWFAVFNLFPFPPLDGSKIILAILPPKYVYKYGYYITWFERYGFWILMILAYTGIIGLIMSPFISLILLPVNFILPGLL